jgi:hypothetical protein
MRCPSAEELAAIAAAYLAVTARATPPRAEASRWALAGRIRLRDAADARFAARAASRWNVAGRLDG